MKITLNLILWSVWLKHFSHFSIKHGGIREPDKNLEFKGMVCHSDPNLTEQSAPGWKGRFRCKHDPHHKAAEFLGFSPPPTPTCFPTGKAPIHL